MCIVVCIVYKHSRLFNPLNSQIQLSEQFLFFNKNTEANEKAGCSSDASQELSRCSVFSFPFAGGVLENGHSSQG